MDSAYTSWDPNKMEYSNHNNAKAYVLRNFLQKCTQGKVKPQGT